MNVYAWAQNLFESLNYKLRNLIKLQGICLLILYLNHNRNQLRSIMLYLNPKNSG